MTVDHTMSSVHYVVLDIGGERFQAEREIFIKFPTTRLGKLINSETIEEILTLCDEFVPGNPPEYFFDHNPETFPGILDMYRSGYFHILEGGRSCAFVMRRDFQYWGLDELDLEPCCALKYYPEIEVCRLQTEGDAQQNQKDQEEESEAYFGNGKLARLRFVIGIIKQFIKRQF